MVQDTTGSATAQPVIAPDPYARQRGKLSAAQERAILALGDYGLGATGEFIRKLMRISTAYALEEKGYAYTPPIESGPQVWRLTTSGCEQYRRLKGIV